MDDGVLAAIDEIVEPHHRIAGRYRPLEEARPITARIAELGRGDWCW
jgi:hypothetical protein